MSHKTGPFESAKSTYGVRPSAHARPAVKNHAGSKRGPQMCARHESGDNHRSKINENKVSSNQLVICVWGG